MNTLILTHTHTGASQTLEMAHGLADRAHAAGHAALVLVADPVLVNSASVMDMVQTPDQPNEFLYPSVKQPHCDYEEGNTRFVLELLPKLLNWFQPDNIQVIDPAAVGWNVLRCVRHACPQATLHARLLSDTGMATHLPAEDVLLRNALLGGALGLFGTLYTQTPALQSLLNSYRSHLVCEPQNMEPAP